MQTSVQNANPNRFAFSYRVGSASNYDTTLQIVNHIRPGNYPTYQELIALGENYQDISQQFYENKAT
jgi:hypothetical protein